MKRAILNTILLSMAVSPRHCLSGEPARFEDVVSKLAPGWKGEIIAQVDQSYFGWAIEIGDADNDGKNDVILTTGKGNRENPGTSHVLLLHKQ